MLRYRPVKIVQKQVKNVVVNTPVLLYLLKTQEAQLGTVDGDALTDIGASADTYGVDAECSKEARDSRSTTRSVEFRSLKKR